MPVLRAALEEVERNALRNQFVNVSVVSPRRRFFFLVKSVCVSSGRSIVLQNEYIYNQIYMNKQQGWILVGVFVVLLGVAAASAFSLQRSERRASVRESRMHQFGENMNQKALQSDAGESAEQKGRRRGMNAGQEGMHANRGNCLADECLAVEGLDYPVGTLSDAAKQALSRALDDEYKAVATYGAVMEKFGNVRPFIMISRAEEQHISSLKALFEKYALAIPANPYTSQISAPATLALACQTGVEAEIANATLYKEQLLPAVADYPDLAQVFTNLMHASENRHLPAFERCD